MLFSTTWSLPVLSLLGGSTLVLGKNNSTTQPQPYTINIDPGFVEETRLKAANFRPSVEVRTPAWFDGPPSANVTSVGKFWAEEYDWFAEQDRINSNFSHYLTTLPPPGGNYNESLDVHFIHQHSQREDAIPLLMLHGWPSTSLEWEKVIPGLVNPEDNSKPAFHVIAPDMPGYGFSPSPTEPGLGALEHATLFASLMEQLGYDRYAVYSTDVGYIIGLKLIVEYSERIINHITDFYILFPTEEDIARYAANKTTPEETRYIASINIFQTRHSGYSSIQSTFPLSIAYALNDSPVGFMAWVWQLVHTASDQVYTPTELITRAFVLYIPGVFGNIRSYREMFDLANFRPSKFVDVPTSVLQFGGMNNYEGLTDFNYAPREWIEPLSNLTYFKRHDRGAHFPAESAPDLVLEDIRDIFSKDY